MGALIRVLAAAVALAMGTGTALAMMGKTTSDVALRRAPTAQAALILNLSKGALVNVGRCSRGWCGVTWNKYAGYVRDSALQFLSTPAGGPPAIPVFPPYPYKAGHYPTADAYYDLPPYAATNPSFYRWRFFMMAQERNRYRYMPYIFHGYKRYPEDTVSSHTLTCRDGDQSPRAVRLTPCRPMDTSLRCCRRSRRVPSAYARPHAKLRALGHGQQLQTRHR